MPIYAYRCRKCGKTKELERSVEKRELPIPCWKRECWDDYHGEPAPMTFIPSVPDGQKAPSI